MKKIIFVVLGFTLLSAVNYRGNKDYEVNHDSELDTIQGTLYFKLISLGSYYNIPDSVVEKFEVMIADLRKKDHISAQDRQLVNVFNTLKENDLIDKPYFHFRIDSGKVITVYANENEYEKVEGFERQRLIEKGKKVNISLKGQLIGDGIFACEEILSVEEVDGKTYWRK